MYRCNLKLPSLEYVLSGQLLDQMLTLMTSIFMYAATNDMVYLIH